MTDFASGLSSITATSGPNHRGAVFASIQIRRTTEINFNTCRDVKCAMPSGVRLQASEVAKGLFSFEL